MATANLRPQSALRQAKLHSIQIQLDKLAERRARVSFDRLDRALEAIREVGELLDYAAEVAQSGDEQNFHVAVTGLAEAMQIARRQVAAATGGK